MTLNVPISGKNSLTFENIVCSQLELQRRAATFSRRRSTMCRPVLQFPSSSFNRMSLLPPISTPLTTPCSSSRPSASLGSNMTLHFSKTRNSSSSKRGRVSSTQSNCSTRMESIIDRPSLASMFYWDRFSRTGISKKVRETKLIFRSLY